MNPNDRIGAASGGWMITRNGIDMLHWAGFAGLVLAMGVSAWATYFQGTHRR
ncbi:MAG: hypothetical protein H0X13_05600 [Ramlibacter sp.]|nr:hypothetical protein [Ramlibacter sp.]